MYWWTGVVCAPGNSIGGAWFGAAKFARAVGGQRKISG